jgi:hypothetical protein
MSAARLGLELGRVDHGAFSQLPITARDPSHFRPSTIVGIGFVCDVDLLALFGHLAAVQKRSGFDSTTASGFTDHEHHFVDLVFGHAAGPYRRR